MNCIVEISWEGRASQKSHGSAKTRRLRRQKKERKSVTRRAAARRVTLFLSFGVGWGTHSATFEKPWNRLKNDLTQPQIPYILLTSTNEYFKATNRKST